MRVLRCVCWFAWAVMCCGLPACREDAAQSEADASAKRPGPNVILISVDTLRADRLGCYGYQRPTSPFLDALAATSVRFHTTMAQATFTLVSHKSIFSAKYPLRLAQEATNADMKTLIGLAQQEPYMVSTFRGITSPLLVGTLRQHGYKTAAFTDGVWMSREMGFGGGFDIYNDERGNLARILPRAHAWLKDNGQSPFFLFIHTYDTHAPYVCPEPFNSKFCRDHSGHIDLDERCCQIDCGRPPLMAIDLTATDYRAISDHYDGKIACADAYLGRFFDELRKMNLYEETLLIVASDHGESLGERAQVGHGGLYIEQVLVPLIIKFPNSWKVAPVVIEEPVELVDIMPTVFECCGLKLPGERDGRSLWSLVRGGRSGRQYVVSQTAHGEGRDCVTNMAKRAVLDRRGWLLIHDARADSMELYNLHADPTGMRSVTTTEGTPATEMLAALTDRDIKAAQAEFAEPEAVQMSEELQEQLRSLGYVGGSAEEAETTTGTDRN